MIWPILLTTVSAYSWYLIMAVHNSIQTGEFIGGLIFISILPSWAGFFLNRKLITRELTYFALILTNLKWFVVFVAVLALINKWAGGLLFLPPEDSRWLAYLLPYCWQALSWYLGASGVIRGSLELTKENVSAVRTMESSLVIYIPAVIILNYMDLPFAFLVLLSGGWFFLLAFNLALERHGAKADYSYRYDLILFHILVPFVVTFLIFAIVFSQQFHQFLQTAQQTLVSVVFFLLSLLEKIFNKPTDVEFNLEPQPGFSGQMAEAGNMQTVSPWILFFCLTLLLFSLFGALAVILKRLKMQVPVAPYSPRAKMSIKYLMSQLWLWLVALVLGIGSFVRNTLNFVKGRLRGIRLKVLKIFRRLLPPQTPYHYILRNYHQFLRLGKSWGLPRQAFETPGEYMLRLQESMGKDKYPGEEIHELTDLFLAVYYGKAQVDWQQAKLSGKLVKAIKRKID